MLYLPKGISHVERLAQRRLTQPINALEGSQVVHATTALLADASS
jgi:hypothetical protein